VAQSNWRRFGDWTTNRGVSLVACLVAGSAALYASYDALVRLAEWAGWDPTAAPGLPLTVDVIALAAGVRYVRTAPEQTAARTLAYKGVVWSGAASVIGNAIVHAGLTPGWSWGHRAVAIATSAVPAVGLGYVVHLVAAPMARVVAEAPAPRRRHAAPAVAPVPARVSAPSAEPSPVPVVTAEPEPEPEREPARPVAVGAPRPGSIKARGLVLIQEAVAAGNPIPTTEEIANELDCTMRHAQNIVSAFTNPQVTALAQ
jgi:hypothetical protein